MVQRIGGGPVHITNKDDSKFYADFKPLVWNSVQTCESVKHAVKHCEWVRLHQY